MPVRESAIPFPDTVKALNRLVEMLGPFQFDTVAAGVALFPYGVVDQLENSVVRTAPSTPAPPSGPSPQSIFTVRRTGAPQRAHLPTTETLYASLVRS